MIPSQLITIRWFRSRIAYAGLPLTTCNLAYPLRNWQEASGRTGLPVVAHKMTDLAAQLQHAYHLTTSGKFNDAISRFRELLLAIPLLVVESKQEVMEAQELVRICREYLVGLLLESARKALPRDDDDTPRRNVEMAAYFTHCDLQPVHKILTLRTAANLAYKSNAKAACASFCRRCLELGKCLVFISPINNAVYCRSQARRRRDAAQNARCRRARCDQCDRGETRGKRR